MLVCFICIILDVCHVFSDLVVPATLHRCAQSIKSALDCEQVFHRLCEEGVLPLAAAGSVNRLLPPDNKARQANNIMIWLRTAKRAEFERFIAIVKEMGVGNRSQEELAEKLEEEYARLRDDPGKLTFLLFWLELVSNMLECTYVNLRKISF